MPDLQQPVVDRLSATRRRIGKTQGKAARQHVPAAGQGRQRKTHASSLHTAAEEHAAGGSRQVGALCLREACARRAIAASHIASVGIEGPRRAGADVSLTVSASLAL